MVKVGEGRWRCQDMIRVPYRGHGIIFEEYQPDFRHPQSTDCTPYPVWTVVLWIPWVRLLDTTWITVGFTEHCDNNALYISGRAPFFCRMTKPSFFVDISISIPGLRLSRFCNYSFSDMLLTPVIDRELPIICWDFSYKFISFWSLLSPRIAICHAEFRQDIVNICWLWEGYLITLEPKWNA